ncbi:Thioredoxin H2 [Vitis vinifera]|uniref:Thioredoxin H2 n=1 Tax=Vitis vinifera TaxID=29760 RepID=A0A438HD68_VITVI|nr:Thioredoxin H2 [Vitis vinifera]
MPAMGGPFFPHHPTPFLELLVGTYALNSFQLNLLTTVQITAGFIKEIESNTHTHLNELSYYIIIIIIIINPYKKAFTPSPINHAKHLPPKIYPQQGSCVFQIRLALVCQQSPKRGRKWEPATRLLQSHLVSSPSIPQHHGRIHFEEAKSTGKLMVIDFSATWCDLADSLEPVINEFAEKYTDVEFVKIDVDELSDVAQEFGVQGMPTFLLIKRGTEVDKVVGAKKEELQKKIQAHRKN